MPYNPNSNNQIINFLCNHSKIDPQHEASGHLHGDPGLVSATADQTLMEYTGGWHPHLPPPTLLPLPSHLTLPSHLPFPSLLPLPSYISFPPIFISLYYYRWWWWWLLLCRRIFERGTVVVSGTPSEPTRRCRLVLLVPLQR